MTVMYLVILLVATQPKVGAESRFDMSFLHAAFSQLFQKRLKNS